MYFTIKPLGAELEREARRSLAGKVRRKTGRQLKGGPGAGFNTQEKASVGLREVENTGK